MRVSMASGELVSTAGAGTLLVSVSTFELPCSSDMPPPPLRSRTVAAAATIRRNAAST
ncbi:hypothetical protein SCALM49S_02758 [Streptomyces californicus]